MSHTTAHPPEIGPLEVEHLSGTRLGRYRLEKLLGHGNRASVYQAKDITTWQTVAIRVLDADLSADRAFVERYRQTIDRLAEARHPNLLPILDRDEHEGLVYTGRPLVAGTTLRDQLGQPRPLGDVLRLFLPIAEALDYAHARGLIHGDLKPGSILLPLPDQPLVADFGLAQAFPQGNSFIATARGDHLGTPEYISPEQGCGAQFDKRADLYALGVMLYEAIVGRPPFRAESSADTARTIVMAHVTTPPPPPCTLLPSLNPAVEQVLLRALAKRPAERYPSGVALCAALAEAEGLPFTADLVALGDGSADPEGDYTASDAHYISHRPSRTRPQWQVTVALVVMGMALLFLALLVTH
ncbi:MAG: serine/threonine-protein kinase [Chloroflexia bacterium]